MNSAPLLSLCLLGIAAMGCLCLSMKRYARRTSPPFRQRPLRRAGWLLLAITLLTAVATQGWGFGLVSLFGALSLAALVIVALLSYRPHWLTRVTLAGALAGSVALGLILLRNL